MSQEVRGNDAPFILNAVERAIIRVPRSSHHGLTKIPTAVKIAGRTYLDLSLLTDINMSQLPEVVLAARLYHLAHTHRVMAVTGQCALWAHGYASIPRIPALTCYLLNVIPFDPLTRGLSWRTSLRADDDHTESRSSVTANH